MGLVFIVVPDVFPHGLHLSELVWAVNFITPWALGLHWPLVPVAEHVTSLEADSWPRKQLYHLRPCLVNQVGDPARRSPHSW